MQLPSVVGFYRSLVPRPSHPSVGRLQYLSQAFSPQRWSLAIPFPGLLTQRLSLAVLLPCSQAFSPSVGHLQYYCLVPRPSHPALVACSTTASFPGLLTQRLSLAILLPRSQAFSPSVCRLQYYCLVPRPSHPAFVVCSTTASFPPSVCCLQYHSQAFSPSVGRLRYQYLCVINITLEDLSSKYLQQAFLLSSAVTQKATNLVESSSVTAQCHYCLLRCQRHIVAYCCQQFEISHETS